MDLKNTIIPKSNQLNSDDLMSGPITVRITAVESGSVEQPVSIRYEGDNKRPYLPSKSMRRVLVVMWGSEGSAYIGRRLTLYRDPTVKFGGEAVGGIKISHASDILQPLEIALTETRGKKKKHRVDVLPDVTQKNQPAPEPKPEPATDLQTLKDLGETKARQGTIALRTWFTSLGKSDQHAVKDLKDAWKATAEETDKTLTPTQ